MQVIIKSLHNGSTDIIRVPEGTSAASVVEKWQKHTIYYQIHDALPVIVWKVAESNDFVKAMIESARL